MKKLIISVLTIITFLSCKNPTYKIETPSKSDIKKAIDTGKNQEGFINSELRIIKDLETGIEKANIEEKPILLYFTGYAVVNSEKIESDLLLKNKTIFQTMKKDYVNVWLYVDDRIVGEKWLSYQKEKFNSNKQPYFVILDSKGKPISKGLNYSQAYTNLEAELLKNK